jgi:hypothetical protein
LRERAAQFSDERKRRKKERERERLVKKIWGLSLGKSPVVKVKVSYWEI